MEPFSALALGADIIPTFNASKCFFLENHTSRSGSGWFLVMPLSAYALISPVQGLNFHPAQWSAFLMHPKYGSLFCLTERADLDFH